MKRGGGKTRGGRFGSSGVPKIGILQGEKVNSLVQFIKDATGHTPDKRNISRFQQFLWKFREKRLPEVLQRIWWGRIGNAYIHGINPELRIVMLDLMEKSKILKANSRIASMCSSQGIFELFLGREFPDCEITAVDYAGRLVNMGKKLATKMGITNVKFVKANVKHTRLESNRRDLVMFLLPALRTPDWPKALDEAKRLLDKNKTTYLAIARPLTEESRKIATLLSYLANKRGFTNIVDHKISSSEHQIEPIVLSIFKLRAGNPI